MKLKYIDINGYGVLVDENAEIKEGDFYYLPGMNGIYRCEGDPTELNLERRVGVAKTLFAEKELNLDSVPILPNWRYEFVDNGYRCRECNEKVALGRKCKKGCSMLSENLVIDVIKKPINQTKAKYTEEDLIGLLQVCKESAIIGTTVFIERKAKEYIQSLQNILNLLRWKVK